MSNFFKTLLLDKDRQIEQLRGKYDRNNEELERSQSQVIKVDS